MIFTRHDDLDSLLLRSSLSEVSISAKCHVKSRPSTSKRNISRLDSACMRFRHPRRDAGLVYWPKPRIAGHSSVAEDAMTPILGLSAFIGDVRRLIYEHDGSVISKNIDGMTGDNITPKWHIRFAGRNGCSSPPARRAIDGLCDGKMTNRPHQCRLTMINWPRRSSSSIGQP